MFQDDVERLYFVCSYMAHADGQLSPAEVLAMLQRVRVRGSFLDQLDRQRLDEAARAGDAAQQVRLAIEGATPTARADLLAVAQEIAMADGVVERTEVEALQAIVDAMRNEA